MAETVATSAPRGSASGSGAGKTWQLVINTSTTIVTFLMVFLIQNTQNRDTLALRLELSELPANALRTSEPPH